MFFVVCVRNSRLIKYIAGTIKISNLFEAQGVLLPVGGLR